MLREPYSLYEKELWSSLFLHSSLYAASPMAEVSKDSHPTSLPIIMKLCSSMAGCLNSVLFYYSNAAMPIQASLQQFQLACSNQPKKMVFLTTYANSTIQLMQKKTVLLSSSIRCAELAHYRCSWSRTLVPFSLYLH